MIRGSSSAPGQRAHDLGRLGAVSALWLGACGEPANLHPGASAASSSAHVEAPVATGPTTASASPTVSASPTSSASPTASERSRCAPPPAPGSLRDGFRKDWPIAVFDISTDGCRVVVSNNMNELLIVDVSRWSTIASIHDGTPNRAFRVAFLDDERIAYCGTDDGLHLWNGVDPPTKIATLPGGNQDCMRIAVDRAEARIALVGYRGGVPPNTLRVFDLDGKILATRKIIGPHEAILSGAWFTGVDDISANTTSYGTRTFVAWGDATPETRSPPSGMAFFGLSDAKEFTALGPSGVLGLVDYASGARRALPRERGVPRTGSFSRDGDRLFVFFQSETTAKSGIATFAYPSLTELRFEPLNWASSYVLTRDGATVLASNGMDIVFLDARTGKIIVTASVRDPLLE